MSSSTVKKRKENFREYRTGETVKVLVAKTLYDGSMEPILVLKT